MEIVVGTLTLIYFFHLGRFKLLQLSVLLDTALSLAMSVFLGLLVKLSD